MARMSVEEILKQIASTVNQEAIAPTEASAEWNLWIQYINRAYQEWADANDWESLRKRFFPSVEGAATASVAIPLDFRKLAGPPLLHGATSDNPTYFPENLPEQAALLPTTDKYIEMVGNHTDGWHMVFNPGTMASGASLEVDYFSTPTSLASNAEIPITQDPQYLIDRTIGLIFEARSDPRFQLEETKARERLLTMVENHNLSKYSSFAGQNRLLNDTVSQGFRLGRD